MPPTIVESLVEDPHAPRGDGGEPPRYELSVECRPRRGQRLFREHLDGLDASAMHLHARLRDALVRAFCREWSALEERALLPVAVQGPALRISADHPWP